MMNLIGRFLGTVLAVLAAAYFVPGFSVDSFYIAAVVAVVLGVLNITLKPILLLLTLPLNIITLGLFSFVINAGLLLLVASFVQGFAIEGFIPALLGGLVIGIVSWLVHLFIK